MFSWREKLFCPYPYTHEDIREFESNNSLECCHEVRIGKQYLHANKVSSGKERQKNQHHDLHYSIFWLMLLKDTESCHTFLFQPAAQNGRTERVRFPGDVRVLAGMTSAYCFGSSLLHQIWKKPLFIPRFCNSMARKRFSVTDSTENHAC